jgi:chorismate dehydratase
LRCLLTMLGLNPKLVQHGTGVLAAGANSSSIPRSRLLIGDQAIAFRQKHAEEYSFWDLGEEWQKLVGLPFVYALWLVRPEVTNAKKIANRVRNLRDVNLANLDDLIADAVGRIAGQSKEAARKFLSRYYGEHLRFTLGEKEKDGLRSFTNLCIKCGLLPNRNFAFHVL